MTERELRLTGTIVVGESATDPGNMGEPRCFTSDGVTYLTVPSAELWGALTPALSGTYARDNQNLRAALRVIRLAAHFGQEAMDKKQRGGRDKLAYIERVSDGALVGRSPEESGPLPEPTA